MADWTDHELETARLRIRDAAQGEQSALFASQTPLDSLSPEDRTKHLELADALAHDLEATETHERWLERIMETDAPSRWTDTLQAIRDN